MERSRDTGSMVIDYYTSIGFSLALLAESTYHRRYPVGNYFKTQILPALWAKQIKIYAPEDAPKALVTWAWLSEAVEKDVHMTGRSLTHEEFSSAY